ncbi:MAG TPA: class I SAM-dependent methyltransferase [Armatimonadota bacterium]|nr:class I SAM-dependent methyltransferase [Armatimonadota bacterium]
MNEEAFAREVEAGERFRFGANWQRFLTVLDDRRIAEAEKDLKKMMEVDNLAGKSFLDVGSGSGLSSLAAMRLGASRVHSFDYDPQSAACTAELKRRYFETSTNWTVETGSALETSYLQSLGQWDIVYSWGVLHHTGDMWTALENVVPLVADRGVLFISIYNDQGRISRQWRWVKRLYISSRVGRRLVAGTIIPYWVISNLLRDLIKRRNPLNRYKDYIYNRGMSRVHDWHDWLGGYPFEVAKPEQIFDFFHARGFSLERLLTAGGGLPCNQYVFLRH